MNFDIKSNKAISKLFRERNILNFYDAMHFVKQLPYRRNENKYDLSTVLTDGYGTCGTKHALLQQLALENNAGHIKLILGIFKMNRHNSKRVADTLFKHMLEYIPEAHNYLRVDGRIADCTSAHSIVGNFADELLSETEIQPEQVADFKVNYHKAFLQQWLKENPHISYSLEELYTIREQCIKDLQRNNA